VDDAMIPDKFQLVRDGIAEFERTGRAGDYFAEDFVWDFSGLEGWIEEHEYYGRAGFDEQMAKWTQPFESWSWDLHEIVDAGGDDVLVIGTQHGILKGSTQPVEMPLAQIFTIRDGQLTRIRLFARADQAYAAAGVEPPAQASA
jgi:ketosteroid isomerase-like protein